MTIKPISETDYYGQGREKIASAKKMVGPSRMNFGAPRVDDDRLINAWKKNKLIDHSPHIPEGQAWNMRPRVKANEIGPTMRFNSHS